MGIAACVRCFTALACDLSLPFRIHRRKSSPAFISAVCHLIEYSPDFVYAQPDE
jgi:hypothetical protein